MQDRYRLPRTVVPSRYDLVLEPDLEAATFSGTVDISVEVHERVTQVVLNALDLAIDGATVHGANGTSLGVTEISLDDDLQRATLTLEEAADPGSWTLTMAFRGELNDQLHGFYRSTYTDDVGTHTIATTQFEAADARRAFPCWDEPDLKAVFSVTLVVPDGVAALSNGPEVGREPAGDGRTRVRFAETMPMSTYLVAFVVGRLEITEPVDVDGVPLRVVHLPGKGHLAGFALEAGAFSLRYFTDYYGLPYPERKVDFVALPDFAQGAMENTGLITYRESLLLVDPEHATQPELENIADVVAHELAHQWFGNLVTMRWWNGIWLNEAFATYMALATIDAWRPDWERWNSFGRYNTAAKEVDALRSTRAIEYPVHSPDDAAGMFDVLTYQKGASILRMLERYLGEDRFREGIRLYLARHAYGNTETHDLWHEIEESSGEPVRRIMDQWIWQGGYPLVTASPDTDGVRLDQRRFVADGGTDHTTWDIPLRVRPLGGAESSVLVPVDGIVAAVPADGAIVVNAEASSFVRVRYEGDLVERLAERLDEVAPLERYGLVDDHWAAVTSGTAPASEFVAAAARYGNEDDLAVWQSLLQGLGWCDRFLEGEPRERLRAFVRSLVAPAMSRLGWEADAEEPDRIRALRGALLQGLGVLGADPNAEAAAREFEAEARAGKPVDASLAAAAVNVVAANGGAADYEHYWTAYRESPTPQEQYRYLYALPLFRDAALFERTLDAAFGDEVRRQDAPFLFAYSVINRDLGDRAWAIMRERWSEAEKRFPPQLTIRMVEGVRYLTKPAQVAEAEEFFADHPIPQSAKMLEQMLERQRVAAALRARATPDLQAYFAD
ncbi:MAG: M1 family metallopeptidase [Actinomycetota bacterium]|nr:M1 family metallopeptidase [Actinomycetota bacterium]